MICTLCGEHGKHLDCCPIILQKKVLQMWSKGKQDATTGQQKPAMGIFGEVINLYDVYKLAFERGEQMKRGESPLD